MSRDSAGHLLPGRISSARHVPASIERPEYVGKAGPREYGGDDRYDAAGIEYWQEWVLDAIDHDRDVYVYFDNDQKVRSPYDAMALLEKLRS